MIFDTDVLIWALRGNIRAANKIDAAPSLSLSTISYMELIRGARNKQQLVSIKEFIHTLGFTVLPLSENVSHRALVYMEEHALGHGLDIADALIAATSAEQGTPLCTANVKHYKVIPNLNMVRFRP